jgi:ribosomal-protein-alanine N-acetyltransferase
MISMESDSPLPVGFRIMSEADLPSILQIEKRSFREPWPRERFVQYIAGGQASPCVVLESEGRVIGYFVVELRAESTHIINLAVHPDHRRRGHASRCLAMIQRLAHRAIEIASARDAALQPLGGAKLSSAAALPSAAGVKSTRWRGPPGASPPPDRHAGEIYLEVEERNLAAQLLYRKMGYRATKILPRHYESLDEDGYLMVRKIAQEPAGAGAAGG